jgi:hypothetical protein
MRHRDTRWLGRSGVEASHTGDARAARESFERIVAAAQADTTAGTGFAISVEASTAARLRGRLDRALVRTPRDLRPLIIKADHWSAVGDERDASSLYWPRSRRLRRPTSCFPTCGTS